MRITKIGRTLLTHTYFVPLKGSRARPVSVIFLHPKGSLFPLPNKNEEENDKKERDDEKDNVIMLLLGTIFICYIYMLYLLYNIFIV